MKQTHSPDKRENLKQYSILPKIKQMQTQIDQLTAEQKRLLSRVEHMERLFFWQRWFR